MKNYKLINVISGWIVFLIASVVYLLTIEPTASFWDCGEFIATSYKLEVGHPPGAPFFMIVGRFFSLFANGPENVARMINSLSALASSATILFLFWTITHLAKRMVTKTDEITAGDGIKIIGSGIVGALAYTFSDTFWFSAVEGEVYAFSSLFTAVVFWAILKWENEAENKHANKWLVLIAYLMGLSIGVHLLNLLAIPAIALVYYFKKYEVNIKSLIIALGISFLFLVGIMYGIIPGVVKVASVFELSFVNTFGFAYNTGVLFYVLVLIACVVGGLYFTSIDKGKAIRYGWILVSVALTLMGVPFLTNSAFLGFIIMSGMFIMFYFLKQNKVLLNTILLVATVIVMGYSSFTMIMIRSMADPPMDQNDPETLFGLQYYLNREQYGDRPLFFGQYYTAPVVDFEYTKPIYAAIDGKYEEIYKKGEYVFDDKFTTVFPRMYSMNDPRHAKAYEVWGKIEGKKIRTRSPGGNMVTKIKPTFTENLRFFFRYQVNFMYLRYFYWNFVGRQNDIQGHGYNPDTKTRDVLNGNWLSGVKFIDEARLGPQDNMPDSLKNNKGRNTYFFLPFILGLIGLFYQGKKDKNNFWVVFTLFFMTGLAIVLYLNQYPYQPRERDYAYAGSFYAFAIWIGLGVMAFSDLLKKIMPMIAAAPLATVVSIVLVPGIMAQQNRDDHDRSNTYTARDFAYNYLQSCEKNAILFTNGDNDTFPLWYLQEVEGVRTDIRVCNLSYLSADWYIEQMQRKAYDSDAFPFTLKREQYYTGKRDQIRLNEGKYVLDLQTQALPLIASEDQSKKLQRRDGQSMEYLPSKNLKLTVNKENIIEGEWLNPKYYDQMADEIQWKLSGDYLLKNHLMVLDLMAGNDWERPIYFAITVSSDNYMNLQKYFQTCGLTYKIVPVESKDEDGLVMGIDTDEMYENMVNKFRWGGVETGKIYLNENNQRMLGNFRNSFARLADALYNEGKTDSALVALNRAIEVIPEQSVAYNYVMMPYVDLYYRLNKKEIANEIAGKLEKIMAEELDYYQAFRGEMLKNVLQEIRLNIDMLRRLGNIYQVNGETENARRIQDMVVGNIDRLKKVF